jgi:serine/threonine protein kinase
MSSTRTIGKHATYTYEEVLQHGAPVDPRVEETRPIILPATRRPRVRVLTENGSMRDEFVYLRQDEPRIPHAHRAYRRIPMKKTVKVRGGHVLFAVQLNHVKEDIYQVSKERVAIKKLHKKSFALYLNAGGHENPYNAIRRMQAFGDDEHILSCIEALEDKIYLYTVMPFCEGGSLTDLIPWNGGGMMEDETRNVYGKILQNLHYLQAHNICYHDLSPDNILQLNGNLVFSDLAMSLIVPNGNGKRQLINAQSPYGKPPYWTPEVLVSRFPFDAYQLDVWASGCVLYNLLTTMMLFNQPHFSDVSFGYFLMAGGLSNRAMNHRAVEGLIDTFQINEHDRQPLLERAMVHLTLSSTIVELLEGILKPNPRERWTLAQIMNSAWMTQG